MASGGDEVKGGPARYTCFDYRREMMLVGLKKQLARGGLPEAEKIALERAISDLEEEIGLA